MNNDTYSGRTTVVASGGQQVSITVYRRGWVVLVGTTLGLAIAPSGAGPIAIIISFVVAFLLSALLSRSAIRRLVSVQATDWLDLEEQLAFERAAFGTGPAVAGYIPRAGVVARELNKCRRVLIQLPLAGVLLVVVFTVVGVIGDTPVTRIVLFALLAVLYCYAAIQTRRRARAVRTLQHLDADV